MEGPISQSGSTDGLIWHAWATPRYLAELQTGVIAQIVHLVVFDSDNNYNIVYELVRAFNLGDGLDAANLQELEAAVASALETLPE